MPLDESLRSKLRRLLNDRFNDEELRQLSFDLSIDYSNLSGATKNDKIIALLEWLERRRRIKDLLAYWQNYRVDIEPHEYAGIASQLDESEPRVVPGTIEFVNRTNERHWLTVASGPTYVLISAPAGYGKTRLLAEIKASYEGQNWVCGYADLRGPLRDSRRQLINYLGRQIPGYTGVEDEDDLEAYLVQIATALLDLKRDALLIFDSVEELNEEQATWLLEGFTLGVREKLKRIGFGRKLRFIYAGRDVVQNWKAWSEKILPLSDPMVLSPFSLEVIEATLQQEAERVGVMLQPADIAMICRHLMYLTAGHPGCMASIMVALSRQKFLTIGSYFAGNRSTQIFHTIVRPVLLQVEQGIPPRLRPVFEVLSVFRCFTYETLNFLFDRNELQWTPPAATRSGAAWALLKEIEATHLVKLKGGFYSDAIVRSLMATRLRFENPDRFRKLCCLADEFYREQLAHSNFNRYQLLVERLYQQLQRHTADPQPLPGETRQSVLDQLTTMLQNFLAAASSEDEREDRRTNLQAILEDDWEWRFWASNLLGDEALAPIQAILRATAD